MIIIGSGPGGLGAAEAFRERNADAPVRILTTDTALPYARPPLSKDFLRGQAESSDAQLQPAGWFEDQRIDVVTASPVDTIDTAAQTVSAAGMRHPYRWLVIASGSAPSVPAFPGGDTALVLRTLDDAKRLRHAADGAHAAVVIGAGFIGCEAAASLAMRGVPTTLVAPSAVPQVRRLGDAAGQRIATLVTDAGARYVGGVTVRSVGDGVVHLDNGVSIDADLVLAATGVTPQSAVADAAGLDTDGARIAVDSRMRTSVDGVYAVGDVASAYNDAAGRRIQVEHWQDAADHGAIAGANAAGEVRRWDAVPGFWSTIGEATLKYHAWGDGFEHAYFRDRGDGFAVWYESAGSVVGVLTHNADDDYERGEDLIAAGRPLPVDIAP